MSDPVTKAGLMRSAELSGVGEKGFGVREAVEAGPPATDPAAWRLVEVLLFAAAGSGRNQSAPTDMQALLAQMSHEIRTPLTHIIGFAELMGAETHGPLGDRRYAEYVEHIRCSGEQLLASFAAALSELERAHDGPADRPFSPDEGSGAKPGAAPVAAARQAGLWARTGRG